jgi:hypothetical protein
MTGAEADLITHKATRECPMIEPHRREICGLVKAREERQHPGPQAKP